MPKRLYSIAESLEAQAVILRRMSDLAAKGEAEKVATELTNQAAAIREIAGHVNFNLVDEQQ